MWCTLDSKRIKKSVFSKEVPIFINNLNKLLALVKKNCDVSHLGTYIKIKYLPSSVQFSSVAQSCPTLRPHELQHARTLCPSPTPGVHPNPCPSSRWCHPTISSSVVPFSSCPQSFPASGYFQMSQLFAWGGQSIGVWASASVLSMNTQDWSALGWTCWVSLQSKGLSTPQFKSINFFVLSFLHSPTITSIHDHWKKHSLD